MTAPHRVFLNGALTGPAFGRFAAFQSAAQLLREHGYSVTSPVETVVPGAMADHDVLKSDLLAMLECDTVALLPCWHSSSDSRMLTTVAARLGKRVVSVVALLRIRELAA
jgi:hypothetical protein